MNRAERIKAAKQALRDAEMAPEARITGSEQHVFVRVTWGADIQVEFPANDKFHAARIIAAINGG